VRPRPSYLLLAVVAIASLGADFSSKAWVEAVLADASFVNHRIEIVQGHLGIVYAQNRGGAWGLFMDEPDSIRRLFFGMIVIFTVAMLFFLYRQVRPHQRGAGVGLALLFGGALGNLVNRIQYNHVIDFIDVSYLSANGRQHHWPTFNLADVAICIGAPLTFFGFIAAPTYGVRFPWLWSFRSRHAAAGLGLRLVAPLLSVLPTVALSFASLVAGPSPTLSTLSTVAPWPATLLGLFLAARVWYHGRRLGQATAAELRALDPRPPILFLRAFRRDEQTIAARGAFWLWVPIGRSLVAYAPVTFEDALIECLMWSGPPVALGRPGESMAPAGAARTYVPDARWRDEVLALAAAAQLVVLVADDTPAVRWEIEQVRAGPGLSRLVIVLPPGGPRGRDKARTAAWYASWNHLRGDLAFLPPVDNHVAAVRFDAAGVAQLCPAKTARAWDAIDAVDAIVATLDHRQPPTLAGARVGELGG
jgi:signal peptidase II